MSPSPVLVHAALMLVSVLFGLNYVVSKEILDELAPRAWVFYRIFLATVLLLPFLALRRRHRSSRSRWPRGRLWLWLLLAALLGVALNQALFVEGLVRTTPKHSAVINTSIPILTLIFAATVRQERLTLRKGLAILVALTGVLTLLEVDRLVLRGEPFGPYVFGNLLTLGNATSFSVFVVVMRHLGRRVDPVAATLVCFVMATFILGAWSIPALDRASLDVLLSSKIWPLALFAILGSTVITYLLNNWALGHVESSLVVLYIYVQPIVATTLEIALGAKLPGTRFWIAAVLVCVGILLAALARRRE